MIHSALVALRFTATWTVLAGLAWPLLTAGVGGLLFPRAATGSLVVRDGVVVGSERVGQPFASERYLHGRPSVVGYDPFSVSGSNAAPSNPALRERVAADAAEVSAREGIPLGSIPPELVAASGSGIDPDLTLAAARLQLPRIARARSLPLERLGQLLDEQAIDTGPLALGTPRVNVLAFNLALDDLEAP